LRPKKSRSDTDVRPVKHFIGVLALAATASLVNNTEAELATKVPDESKVTLTKSVREAAIVEPKAALETSDAYIIQLKDMSRRRPFRGFSTAEIMAMTRGDD
jgi:hypothetical protein